MIARELRGGDAVAPLRLALEQVVPGTGAPIESVCAWAWISTLGSVVPVVTTQSVRACVRQQNKLAVALGLEEMVLLMKQPLLQ